MAPPKGNEFYKLRMSVGRKNKLTPLRLKREALKHMEEVIANPFIVSKQVMHQGEVCTLMEEKPKLLTIGKLCRAIGICETTFRRYETEDAYAGITREIKGIMRDYQLDGAAAGEFNQNIVARLLGLGDKVEVEVTEALTPEQRKAKMAELLSKCS